LPPYAVLTLPEVVAGPHTIRVEKAGYRTKEKAVVVPPEQTTSLELRLTAAGEPVRRRHRNRCRPLCSRRHPPRRRQHPPRCHKAHESARTVWDTCGYRRERS
jgi:hypothetical protein